VGRVVNRREKSDRSHVDALQDHRSTEETSRLKLEYFARRMVDRTNNRGDSQRLTRKPSGLPVKAELEQPL
jgi:hypothetical protein